MKTAPLALPSMRNAWKTILLIALTFAFAPLLSGQTTVPLTNGENSTTPYDTTDNDTTFTINSGTATQSGVVSGSGDLIKIGDGTVNFTAANTYTGTTTVSTGTLAVSGAEGVLNGTSSISVGATDTATLSFSGGASLITFGTLTLGDTSSGHGSLLVNDEAEPGLFAGSVIVGNAGSGTVNIASDARLNAFGLFSLGAGTGGFGETTIDGGSLLSGNMFIAQGADSTASLTITNGGYADLGFVAGTVEIASAPGSVGQLNILNGGQLWVRDIDSVDGLRAGSGTATVTIDGGELNARSGNLTSSIDITISDNATFRSGLFAMTLGGVISGDGTLVHASTGSGTLLLTGANTYTGGTTLDGGTLILGSVGALGSSGTISFEGGTLRFTADNTTDYSARFSDADNQDYSLDTQDQSVTLATALTSEGGSLAKLGSGTLTLAADNTYTGLTSVADGTLAIGAGGTSGSISGDILNNGTVAFHRSDDHTYNGVISGTGDLVNDGHIVRLSSAQTYTGATTVNSGYLVLSTEVDQGLSASTTVAVADGASFDFSNSNLTIAGLIGAGDVYSFGGSDGHLTVNVGADQEQTFSGELGSNFPNFAFTKDGEGSLTLSSTNTHTGPTTITGGTLILNGSTSAASALLVEVGGTLGGTGTIGGLVTVAGTLSPGQSPGTLNFLDNLTFEDTASLMMEITGIGAGEFDILNGNGTNTLSLDGALILDNTGYTATLGDTITVFTDWDAITGMFAEISGTDLGGGLQWDTSYLYSSGSLTVIPEPTTTALLVGALGTLALLRRRAAQVPRL